MVPKSAPRISTEHSPRPRMKVTEAYAAYLSTLVSCFGDHRRRIVVRPLVEHSRPQQRPGSRPPAACRKCQIRHSAKRCRPGGQCGEPISDAAGSRLQRWRPAPPQNEPIATIPASESLSSHPPSGIVATGSGKFELYRQGDLTFRLNTETGDACVLFATETEWSKALVYEHGCNGRR